MINQLFVFAIFALAIARLSYGLVKERGFLSVFHLTRTLIGRQVGYWVDDEWYIEKEGNEIGQMLVCTDCTSLALSIILFPVVYFYNPFIYALVPFAASWTAMFIINKAR